MGSRRMRRLLLGERKECGKVDGRVDGKQWELFILKWLG